MISNLQTYTKENVGLPGQISVIDCSTSLVLALQKGSGSSVTVTLGACGDEDIRELTAGSVACKIEP